MSEQAYVGRFAPSPTGPLHLGSLITAVASYLDCKKHQGRYLVRIEDLDPPREVAGSDKIILETLEAFQIYWDGDVVYQSQRRDLYEQALAELENQALVYRCVCTRKSLRAHAQHGALGVIYPNTCRDRLVDANKRHAVRVKVTNHAISVVDPVFGKLSQNLARELGDFIIRRSDGWFAYQFAVVVDDALQGITHVVRGADLLDSTPRQIYLQQCLHYPSVAYLHIPLLVKQDGIKLSKQTGAPPISLDNKSTLVHQCLEMLGQQPPAQLAQAELADVWTWAIEHWQPERMHPNPIVT